MNPEQTFRLDGAPAVVTGGGIGNAIARTFHAAGASVFLLDLNAEAAQAAAQAIGPQVVAIACDVSDEQSVEQAFAEIAQTGPSSILVNCAGVAHVGTVLNTSTADFDRLFRVNVRGTYLCMAAAAHQMQQAGAGVILNFASIAATSGLPDRFAYSMTKGAVLSMTLSAARDLLPFHIRCNCISPARVHTPFVDGFLARTYPGREQEMFEVLSRSQPVGRMGTPDEVALLALFLCSPAASFMTGTDYPIDGGFFNLR
jgi:2-keto-3-deoxy-L-fuconate dehydrogenase